MFAIPYEVPLNGGGRARGKVGGWYRAGGRSPMRQAVTRGSIPLFSLSTADFYPLPQSQLRRYTPPSHRLTLQELLSHARFKGRPISAPFLAQR